jgi:hypothetical protein
MCGFCFISVHLKVYNLDIKYSMNESHRKKKSRENENKRQQKKNHLLSFYSDDRYLDDDIPFRLTADKGFFCGCWFGRSMMMENNTVILMMVITVPFCM